MARKVSVPLRHGKRFAESTSPTSFQSSSPEPEAGPSRAGRKRPRPSYAEPDDDDEEEEEEEEEEIEEEEEVEEADALDELDGEGEAVVEAEEEEEEDGEGELEVDEAEEEYESEEDALAVGPSGVSSQVVSEDIDQVASPSPEPILLPRKKAGGMKIRLNLGSGVPSSSERGQRAAAKKAGKKTKKRPKDDALGSDDDDDIVVDDAEGESDPDLGEEASTRSGSPSKLTARQRAKGNKDLQETLMALPNEAVSGKKLELTEAERLQKREEMARRRKRQNDQRLQDEQDQTINRLLRAQTGRSRAKLDAPTADPSAATSRVPSPSARARVQQDTIRWTCRLVDGKMDVRVGVPNGKDAWIELPSANFGGKRDARGVCAVEGCGKGRKYRCVKDFEKGGCSMEHLKLIDASLTG